MVPLSTSEYAVANRVPNPPGPAADALFTLTDYRRVAARDNRLLANWRDSFRGRSISSRKGRGIARTWKTSSAQHAGTRANPGSECAALDGFLLDHGNSLLYVGTRLHGGISPMHGVSALIIQVDNRAAEIAKDTGLPVIGAEFDRDIERWLTGQLRLEPLRIPLGNIERWRA